jgi:hypothetical protein
MPLDYCSIEYLNIAVTAYQAVETLRARGRRARLAEDLPEWRAAGFPVERGDRKAR